MDVAYTTEYGVYEYEELEMKNVPVSVSILNVTYFFVSNC